MKKHNNIAGVTLIEITLALFIMGILVGITLPRYQVAVETSHSKDGVNILNTIYGAQQRYELYNGAPAVDINDLDVVIPESEYFDPPSLIGGGGNLVANIQRTGGAYTIAINVDGEIFCNGTNCTKMGFTEGAVN